MSAFDLTFAAQSETVIDGLQDVMHLVLRRLNIDVASFVCLFV